MDSDLDLKNLQVSEGQPSTFTPSPETPNCPGPFDGLYNSEFGWDYVTRSRNPSSSWRGQKPGSRAMMKLLASSPKMKQDEINDEDMEDEMVKGTVDENPIQQKSTPTVPAVYQEEKTIASDQEPEAAPRVAIKRLNQEDDKEFHQMQPMKDGNPPKRLKLLSQEESLGTHPELE